MSTALIVTPWCHLRDRTFGPRLDEPNERPDDAVKQSGKLLRKRLHPAKRFRCFEASKRLASGSGRRLISRLPIPPARIRALGNVERNRNERALELVAKRRRPRP